MDNVETGLSMKVIEEVDGCTKYPKLHYDGQSSE